MNIIIEASTSRQLSSIINQSPLSEGIRDQEVFDLIGDISKPFEKTISTFTTDTAQELFYREEAGLEQQIEVTQESPEISGLYQQISGIFLMKDMYDLVKQFEGRNLSKSWKYFQEKPIYRSVHATNESLLLQHQNNSSGESISVKWELPQDNKFTRLQAHYRNFKDRTLPVIATTGSIDMFYDEYPEGFQLLLTLNGYPFFNDKNSYGILFNDHMLGGSFDNEGNSIPKIPRNASY